MKRELIKKLGSPGLINDKFYIFMIILFFTMVSGLSEHTVYAQNNSVNKALSVSIADGDEWYYFKGPQTPPKDWYSPDIDVSNWQIGATGIGYGTGTNRSYLENMKGNYLTLYARTEFFIDKPAAATRMDLSVVCDGPFIAYINGIEVIRTNTVQISPQEQQLSLQEADKFDISGFAHELFPDKNVLAVECSNDDINSINFSFISSLEVLMTGEGR